MSAVVRWKIRKLRMSKARAKVCSERIFEGTFDQVWNECERLDSLRPGFFHEFEAA